MSIERTTVYADPTLVTDPIGEAARLAPLLHVGRADTAGERSPTRARPQSPRHFVYLAHTVSRQRRRGGAGPEAPGIGFVPESARSYPAGSVAAAVIGAGPLRRPRRRRDREASTTRCWPGSRHARRRAGPARSRHPRHARDAGRRAARHRRRADARRGPAVAGRVLAARPGEGDRREQRHGRRGRRHERRRRSRWRVCIGATATDARARRRARATTTRRSPTSSSRARRTS